MKSAQLFLDSKTFASLRFKFKQQKSGKLIKKKICWKMTLKQKITISKWWSFPLWVVIFHAYVLCTQWKNKSEILPHTQSVSVCAALAAKYLSDESSVTIESIFFFWMIKKSQKRTGSNWSLYRKYKIKLATIRSIKFQSEIPLVWMPAQHTHYRIRTWIYLFRSI